jgi:uncharacterized Fe-S cluster protein YjdI
VPSAVLPSAGLGWYRGLSTGIRGIDMNVSYDPKVCIHSGNCVKSLPAVFKVVGKQFVIDPKAASEAAMRQTVAACPSGALQMTED